MDDDISDIVDQLCTRIGMLMEDAEPTALTTRRLSFEQRAAAVAQLHATARRILALAEAANTLIEWEEITI